MYAQQSKELANIEQDNLAKRIEEFRTQTELDQLRASSNVEVSTSVVHINGVGMSSYKNIEAIMQSTAKGEIQTIKQGYLLKRSSSLRVDWKRRFFVLDGHGKRSSRKVVIRNINYITSKGDGEKGSASEDSSDEHESINAESLKQQVEELYFRIILDWPGCAVRKMNDHWCGILDMYLPWITHFALGVSQLWIIQLLWEFLF